jgi:hypothetical protein
MKPTIEQVLTSRLHCNLGNTISELARLEKAELAYKKVIEIKSDYIKFKEVY